MIYAGDNSENNLTYSKAPTLPSQAAGSGEMACFHERSRCVDMFPQTTTGS